MVHVRWRGSLQRIVTVDVIIFVVALSILFLSPIHFPILLFCFIMAFKPFVLALFLLLGSIRAHKRLGSFGITSKHPKFRHSSTTFLPRGGASTNTTAIPAWKQALPASLHNYRALQRLQMGNVTLYLLGTAHVSNQSVTDATVLVQHVQPDALFLELCEARVGILLNETENTNATSFWQHVRTLQQEGASRSQAMATALLSSIQDNFAGALKVDLGGEFRAAYTTATNTSTKHVVLGDRPVALTLQRAWESLSWFGKLKLFIGMIWSAIFKPSPAKIQAWLTKILQSDTDVLTESFKDLQRFFPTLYTTIISERDAWMAAKLVQTAWGLARTYARPVSCVAVVGAGHVPGICAWLTNGTTATPDQILEPLCRTQRWKQVQPEWVHGVMELPPDFEEQILAAEQASTATAGI